MNQSQVCLVKEIHQHTCGWFILAATQEIQGLVILKMFFMLYHD